MLMLDADPDMFLERTIDELDFIGAKLALLHKCLEMNERLISKNRQLHNLDETYERFLDLINDMLHGEGCFNADRYPSIRENLSMLASYGADCQRRLKELKALSNVSVNDARLVGRDELTALLDGI
jgi:hypothetical protein